ncbi:hypothetical protein [Pseudomonas chlororaphis]|uniref:hypothetical protein n=1 Tax=Pseudomonas chlororaphis TaxID=587753 RepID=UPI0023657AC8|nr:hypothetical protein [Pseudomonas chlororaphis]WDH24989.1 hypothetical protein PUP50_12175 [Pseudomonas chlororaphis]
MPTENNPAVIYLGPACEAETGDGRTWAEDWPWPDCECGHQPVQYVLGETFNRVKAERDALQQRLTVADQRVDELEQRNAEFPYGTNVKITWWNDASIAGWAHEQPDGRLLSAYSKVYLAEDLWTVVKRKPHTCEAKQETLCKTCNGEGTVGTGISEAPSTACNACEGTGNEQ